VQRLRSGLCELDAGGPVSVVMIPSDDDGAVWHAMHLIFCAQTALSGRENRLLIMNHIFTAFRLEAVK
jgi:hypothetical protein